jgi:hypothetical protein
MSTQEEIEAGPSRSRMIGVLALALMVVCASARLAAARMEESDIPATSVVPSEENAASKPAPPKAPPAAKKPAPAHASTPASRPDVEPGRALAKLSQDTPVVVEPFKGSKQIEIAHAGKFIQVTGSTREFLQVSLKSGQVGYVEASAIELEKPTDKIFALTSDAAVLDKPNKWGKKLSEVHKGHDVHAVAVALNYVKIKMKSGLEGFIPLTALQ